MERVTFYVDGFNFYNGLRAKKRIDDSWKKTYWIDMVKFFNCFLSPDQILEKVIYFTASPLSSSKNSRQSAFLNANKLINGDKFEIVRGKYLTKTIVCPYCGRSRQIPEEKKTDVNISIRMIGDCVKNSTDIVILVSGDSDLLPPLEYIIKNYPQKKVRAYFPPTIFSTNIKSVLHANKCKIVMLENNFKKFIDCVMPDIVEGNENVYTIPNKWK